jgi:hypothetical protein
MNKNNFPYLRIGVSRNPLPIYASYLNSDGKHLIACNDDIYIKIKDDDIPFVGSVNFFVLDSILKISPNASFSVEENNLVIRDGTGTTQLPILTTNFPNLTLDSLLDSFTVTEDLYYALKMAMSFRSKSDSVYSNVCLIEDKLISTDKYRLFLRSFKEGVNSTKMGIDGNIFSTLQIGDRLGVDINKNAVVQWDSGFGVFTINPIDEFPHKKILSFVENATKDLIPISTTDECIASCERLVPVLLGENNAEIELKNEGGKLTLLAESAVNGSSKVILYNRCDDVFNMYINFSSFKNLPSGFDIFVNEDKKDKLVLTKDETILILMGREGV